MKSESLCQPRHSPPRRSMPMSLWASVGYWAIVLGLCLLLGNSSSLGFLEETVENHPESRIQSVNQLLGHPLSDREPGQTLIEVSNIVMEFPEEQYTVSCRRVRTLIPESKIIAEAIEVRPSDGDEAFLASRNYRRARLHLTIPYCELSGLDRKALLEGRGYSAQMLLVQDAVLDALIDHDKPINPNPPIPPMPMDLLHRLKSSLRIDRVEVTNSRVLLQERRGTNIGPGAMTFDRLQLSVLGLTNRGETNSIRVRGRANFMNAGLLSIDMTIPAAARDLSFRYSGTLSAMDLTLLNPFLEVVSRARLKDGRLQEASFQSEVISGHARGEFRGVYQGLDLAFIDLSTGTERGVANRAKSFLADHLIMRTSNLPEKGVHPRVGVIDYTRKPEEKFLHFLWFAIRSGMIDLLGVSDFVKNPH